MTNQTSAKVNRVSSLVIFCAVVLVTMLTFRFSGGFKASVLLNEAINDLVSVAALSGWGTGLRRYGAYAVANIELITLFFIVIKPLRRIGAWLGVLLAAVTLTVALLVTLASSDWLTQAKPVDLGLSLGLAVLLGIGSFLVLRSERKAKAPEQPQEWKLELEKELAQETMEATPIADYSELTERVPFHNEATDLAEESFNQLLLNVSRELRDVIEGEHRSAFIEAQRQLDTLPAQHKYFPRQPMIIPKLIRAVNSDDSTKKKLVEVISQDPVIAGELLRVANSPYYRLSEGSVDSIGRAILVLGMDGLRALTSALVLQPVAQTDKTYFPEFTKRIWLQSVLAANAAQAYARKTRSCDSFTAHLLGLLSSIGHIVIFQMLLDVYKKFSGVHPKIEVLNKLQRDYADEVSASVIESWNLSDEFVATLKSYQLQGDINDMKPLGRALYYGRLCAALNMLHESGRYTEVQAREVMLGQGLHPDVFDAMWKVLMEGEQSLSEVWG
jgi:HD-like signal output (HDOD) protein